MTSNNSILKSETIERVRAIINKHKAQGAPANAIKALEESLDRIINGRGDSKDHGRLARVLGLNE